jgi:hypothetical protein
MSYRTREKIITSVSVVLIVALMLLSLVWFFDRRADCRAAGGEWVQGWPTWTCVGED